MPPHWLTVCLLLGGVAAGRRVVVASSAENTDGCGVAFVEAARAEAVTGVDDVYACPVTPFPTRTAGLSPFVEDLAVELPSYGDHFAPRRPRPQVIVGGRSLEVPSLALGPTDRVLVTGLDLSGVLGALAAGAAVVLLGAGDPADVARAESVTATWGPAGLVR